MKKIISFLLAVLLLFSFALAEDDFFERWNKAANVYGSPEVTQDMINDDGNKIIIETDTWSMTLIIRSDAVIRADVSSSDAETALHLATVLATAAVTNKTADSYNQFLGNLLYRYLKESKGKHTSTAAFELFDYSFHLEDGIYTFHIER